MAAGQIYRMTKWDNVSPNFTAGFKTHDRKTVAVFVMLGHEPKDGSKPLDLEQAMNALGWYAKDAAKNSNGG